MSEKDSEESKKQEWRGIQMLRKWERVPDFMKCDEVRLYYDILIRRKKSLYLKRTFDMVAAAILLVFLALPMAVIAVMIRLDSPGPIFYRQERVTAYGKRFRIHKFRTMVKHADQAGPTVTVLDDNRVTKMGLKLRDCHLDELPQLIDVLEGNMSFVGTRPELPKYVKAYTKEMCATLLLPAGITSEASIRYRDEAGILKKSMDVDIVYLHDILPQKMEYNLEAIKNFSLYRDVITIIKTMYVVFGRKLR